MSRKSCCGIHVTNGCEDQKSGSVLGPVIVRELMDREAPTIVLAIADQSSYKYTYNSMQTLKSYESYAKSGKYPIIMGYFFNTDSKSRKEVDKYIINTISDLRCLFSNQNIGLDEQDLFHWLRYDRVTNDYPNQLASFTIINDGDNLDPKWYGKAISVATLATEDQPTDYAEIVDYHVEGVIPEALSSQMKEFAKPVHFVISDGVFDRIVDEMSDHLGKLEKEKESRVVRKSLVTKDDVPDEDTGLIL